MKTILILIVFVFNINMFSQTYILDDAFGSSGIMKYNKNIEVKNGLLVNNNYYFISTNAIVKIDYNGQIVSNYGVNGLKSLQQTNETLTITSFVFHNNFFYVYV